MDSSSHKSLRASVLYGSTIAVGFLVQTITSLLLVRSGGAEGPWSMLPALFAVLVMLVYLYLSHLHTPRHVKTLDFADGFYYLGFLFTLFALILTLILMGSTSLDSNRFILSQFGLALITTVFGLAVKLLLSLEYESSPPSLKALIDEAKKSLQATRDAGDAYRVTMSQVTEETRATLTHGTEILRATVDQMKNPLANALDGLVQELDGANEKVRDSHKELTDAVIGIGSKLSASVSELTDSLAAAQRESSRIGPLFPGLENGLSGLTAEFESLSKQMASSKDSFGQLMAESTQLLSTSSEAVARAAISLEKVTGTILAEAEKGGGAIRDRIKESTESISAYAKALKEAAATVKEVAVRPFEDIAAAQKKNQGMLTASAERASGAVDELTTSLKTLADESISAYAKALKEAAATAKEVAVGPFEDMAAAQKKNQGMLTASAERASGAVDELTDSLKTLAEVERTTREDLNGVRRELVTAVKALRDELDG